jgi:hypothetical protein
MKLECRAKKVIPDSMTLEEAYRRALVQRRLAEKAELLRAQAEREAEMVAVPVDLCKRVHREVNDNQCIPWDKAVIMVLRRNGEAEP